MKFKYKVNGISCTNCVKTIKNTVSNIYPNADVKVNINTGTVYVNNIKQEDISKIKEAISKSGYEEIKEEKKANDDLKFKRDLLIAVICSFPLLIGMFGHLSLTSSYIPSIFTNHIFQLFFATIIQFYIGSRYYKGAYNGLKNKVLGMDFLVVLGSTTAYIYSLYIIIFKENTHEVYFEVSALIITIVLIGKYLEHNVKRKTASALDELINLNVKEARMQDNTFKDIEFVDVDEVMVVLANEQIPLDGVILEGETYVDESSFTGESRAVNKKVNDRVIGGSLNINQQIKVKVINDYEESLLNTIVNSVEEASLIDTKYQRIADKAASIFVPVVLIIALATYILTTIVTKDSTVAFEHAISVIVISCPCALGLATPTSIMVSNSISAKRGILYKGGAFFEIADKIDVICFDKTGTITKGTPEVVYFEVAEEYVDLIYTIESQSNHPISKSVSSYLKDRTILENINITTIKGKGLSARYQDLEIKIGNDKLVVDANNLDNFKSKSSELLAKAMTVNYILVNNEIVGLYGLRDEIKSESISVIKRLKERNIKTVLITGDNEVVANVIAKEVGIDDVYYQTLPTDKSEIVKKYQAENKIVGFVGDGINDSVALTIADVGISVKDGSDIAINASDVTLIYNDLNLIIDGIDLSRATRKNIKQNFMWAFSYNIIAIPLAAFGYLNMVVAAAAMGFSSIVVVLNALRLKKFKFNETNSKEVLYIKNMNCNKCVNKITNILLENNIEDFEIKLENKSVLVDKEEIDKVKKVLVLHDYQIED